MTNQKSKSKILKKRAKKDRPGWGRRLFWWFFWMMIGLGLTGTAAVVTIFWYLSQDLPRITTLADYRPPVITTVFSDDNRKIAEFSKERRIVIPLAEMPEMLTQAFIAAEDSRFYQHGGIDIISIVRAFFKNLEAGAIVQGGSTITQQVTKSFLLTPERSYTRKIKEAILAYRIDKTFTKEEILFLYLNQIYLGHGAYGVEAAAQNYFGKPARDMNLAECAVLGVEDKLKGQIPIGFLVLNAGVDRPSEEIQMEVVKMVRERIGPVAAFKTATVVNRLPKTRSGKILRGTIQKIADNKEYKVPATIDDPTILGEMETALKGIGYGTARQ